MPIRLTEAAAQLYGHWVQPNILDGVGILDATLQQVVTAGTGQLQIDCERIEGIDRGGLELLYTWIECARLCGVEPVLTGLPEHLQQTMACLTSLIPNTA